MSEYWKSTPSYWCKFCSRYVRDSAIEKRNHESSVQHQNNIQRNLRDINKGHQREEWDKQRAKDEVARLKGEKIPSRSSDLNTVVKSTTSNLTPAQQRKAHAEQLVALGVALPDDLKREVTGVGDFKVVNEREVLSNARQSATTVQRSLADILAEERSGVLSSDTEQLQDRKRKIVDEDADEDGLEGEELLPRKRAWGSNFKTYPSGNTDTHDATEDLDALLGSVDAVKKGSTTKREQGTEAAVVKQEDITEELSSSTTATPIAVKKEESASDLPSTSAVVFKKRKAKK